MDNFNTVTADDVWNRMMMILEKELSSVSIDRWLRNLTPDRVESGVLYLLVPDNFFKDWIEDHYHEHILKALSQSYAFIHHYELIVSANRPAKTSLEVAPSSAPAPSAPVTSDNVVFPPSTVAIDRSSNSIYRSLNAQYTFDEFVVGPSNRFAHAACLAVALQPAKAYNPLFIYGPVGLGKTHLMEAIGNSVVAKNPAAKVLYITSEQFTNQLINAIQNQTTLQFREKYRNCDILLIDDIQFIGGKEATQEEFFHTFNSLYDAHKQIVVSSDRPPKDINNLEERLISRFEWGLVTDIQKPDFETRSAILRKKGAKHNIHIPDEVTNYIAEVTQSNIRELEGSLMRVVAYAQLTSRPINIEIAQEVLKKALREAEKRIDIDGIQRRVAEYFNIERNEMFAKRRNKNVVLPRQIAMFFCRELTPSSLPEIGTAFGGRDHTTVIHACEKIKTHIESDRSLRDTVNRIKDMLVG